MLRKGHLIARVHAHFIFSTGAVRLFLIRMTQLQEKNRRVDLAVLPAAKGLCVVVVRSIYER